MSHRITLKGFDKLKESLRRLEKGESIVLPHGWALEQIPVQKKEKPEPEPKRKITPREKRMLEKREAQKQRGRDYGRS